MAVAPLIGFFAQLDGGGLPSIVTLSVGVGPAISVLASFVNPASSWQIASGGLWRSPADNRR